MRKVLILTGFLFISCATDKNVHLNAFKHANELETIAGKIYPLFDHEMDVSMAFLDSLPLTKNEKRLVKRKLKSEVIYVNYAENIDKNIDSIVVFRSGGVWQRMRGVIVDMRKEPRDSLPCNCPAINNRVYFKTEKADIPLY